MLGMIGDRLRRWLDGGSRPTPATAQAANELRPLPSEMDGGNGDSHSTRAMTSTPTGPAATETQAVPAGQAYEANNED